MRPRHRFASGAPTFLSRVRSPNGRERATRSSIEERYPSRAHYLGLVTEAALDLASQGYVLGRHSRDRSKRIETLGVGRLAPRIEALVDQEPPTLTGLFWYRIAVGAGIDAAVGKTHMELVYLEAQPDIGSMTVSVSPILICHREKIEALAERLPEPRLAVIVPGSDHFFTGKLDELERGVSEWIAARPWESA